MSGLIFIVVALIFVAMLFAYVYTQVGGWQASYQAVGRWY